jgi:hypothetical protein|tara:strand:+ start:78 stop:305 length:228 start_codon:yes stop_codon:yes gene_type:complete
VVGVSVDFDLEATVVANMVEVVKAEAATALNLEGKVVERNTDKILLVHSHSLHYHPPDARKTMAQWQWHGYHRKT